MTHNIVVRAQRREGSTADRLAAAEREVLELAERRVTGEPVPVGQVIAEVFADFDRKHRCGVETGLSKLDAITGGLQPSELTIVAGRTTVGKTALCLTMAEHMAITCDRKVLFLSIEMSQHQLGQRLLAMRSEVPVFYQRAERGELGDIQQMNLDAARQKLDSDRLLIDDASGITIEEMRAKARIAKRKHDLQVIFVDYLQLLSAPRRENRQVEVATISRGLKAMAKEIDVPVVAAAQLSRGPEYRPGKKPTLADLRESGAIEQDADLVYLLWAKESVTEAEKEQAHIPPPAKLGLTPDRPLFPAIDETIPIPSMWHPDPQKRPRKTIDLIIAKHRNGPTGTVELAWNKQAMRFENR